MIDKVVYLFVSPHLDDVALSCGGYIYQLTLSGNRVVVATVITEDSSSNLPLTQLAHRNHLQWGAGDAPFALRRQEDSRAMESLGVEKYVHFGLPDAIYRRAQNGEPLYEKDTVNIPVHMDDWLYFEPVVKEKLAAFLQLFINQTVRIFCPLALATHVDHVIIRNAVEKVVNNNSIIYYEEFPYITRPNVFYNWQKSKDGSQGWYSMVIELSEGEIDARVTAISFYETQVSFLFPSTLLSLHEIALAHIPVIENFFPLKPNRASARQRMGSFVKSYVSAVNGERYWFKGTSPRY